MGQLNTIGVDLAKNVIQVSVVSASSKELLNKALTRTKFKEFLAKQQPALVAFEACASSDRAAPWTRGTDSSGPVGRAVSSGS